MAIKQYCNYLQIERGLSAHTLGAYASDLHKLAQYFHDIEGPLGLQTDRLAEFLIALNKVGMASASQSRLLSCLRSFYRYLIQERLLSHDPTESLHAPKSVRKFPEVLTFEEIEMMISAMDMSVSFAHRHRAIIETLYGSGLRVSELTHLLMEQLHLDLDVIRVIGKGNKERLVPLGGASKKHLRLYIEKERVHIRIAPQEEGYVFLNAQGRHLSRIAIYQWIRAWSKKAGIKKKVSPHTFRHSFATHLIERGANLRAVQEMLGHASITTTEIYTHLDIHYLRQTIRDYHPRG